MKESIRIIIAIEFAIKHYGETKTRRLLTNLFKDGEILTTVRPIEYLGFGYLSNFIKCKSEDHELYKWSLIDEFWESTLFKEQSKYILESLKKKIKFHMEEIKKLKEITEYES